MEKPIEDATRTEANPSDLNRDIALMVKEISKIGPRVPEIARRIGRHKETVRYWYKKLEEHNFAINCIVNHEALGLRRIIIKVKFGDAYADYIKPLMFAMNELCYVVGYAKTLPDDLYVVDASVPEARVEEYLAFIEELRGKGVFTEAEPYVFDWFRNVPMRADYYDFELGRWNYDMSEMKGGDEVEPPLSSPQKLDRIDVLLVKELFVDARREVQDIQRSIREQDGVDINYKTLCWHLKEHVEGRGLLKGYRTNWMGTHYDQKSGRAGQRQHAYVGAELFVRGPSLEEKGRLMRMMGRFPVVWSEAVGKDYHVQMAIPSEMIMEGLEYIHETMEPVRNKSTFYLMDQMNAAGFTFSYKLYNEEARAWDFDRSELMAKFEALELQIKSM
jgi:DNA-binding Lrp family transcriptional regulator